MTLKLNIELCNPTFELIQTKMKVHYEVSTNDEGSVPHDLSRVRWRVVTPVFAERQTKSPPSLIKGRGAAISTKLALR